MLGMRTRLSQRVQHANWNGKARSTVKLGFCEGLVLGVSKRFSRSSGCFGCFSPAFSRYFRVPESSLWVYL